MTRKKTINIRDLFIEPNFNELEAVSTDSKGAPKKLNHSQLESLRSSGEFQVDSVQFTGQKHTWRLSKILQKGADRSRETLYKDLSHALKLIGKVLLELRARGIDCVSLYSVMFWLSFWKLNTFEKLLYKLSLIER